MNQTIENFDIELIGGEIIKASNDVHYYFFTPAPVGSILTLFSKIGDEFGGNRPQLVISDTILHCKYIGITRTYGNSNCFRLIPIESVKEFKLK